MKSRPHLLIAALVFVCVVVIIGNSQGPTVQTVPIPKTDNRGPSLKLDFPGMLVGVGEVSNLSVG